eukprot:664331-Prymnesium_polylepis.2
MSSHITAEWGENAKKIVAKTDQATEVAEKRQIVPLGRDEGPAALCATREGAGAPQSAARCLSSSGREADGCCG